MISFQCKKTYNRLLSERLNEIRKISKKIDYNNLTYYFKTKGIPAINFIKFKGPFSIFKETRAGNKTLKEIEKDQENLKSSLKEISLENPRYQEKYQLDAIVNVKNHRFSRKKFIGLLNDHSRIRSEALYKSKQNEKEQDGTGLKILTPKQMLQRLPIALAQVKAGNNSKNLLIEIRQIVYNQPICIQ